jgi:maltose O-acetyltransferase
MGWSKIRRFIYLLYSFLLFRKKVNVTGYFTVGNLNNLVLGENVTINGGVYISARNKVIVMDDVILSHRCMLLDAGFDAALFLGNTPPVYKYVESTITIGKCAWIGAGAIILPGVHVGEGSIVAAGSVVTKNVPDGSLVAGNPARIIKMRFCAVNVSR